MSKFTNYFLLMTGLLLLFHLTGLIGNTGTLISILLEPSKISLTNIGTQAFAAITLIAVTGIGLGVFVQNSQVVVMSIFTPFLFTILWDFLLVFNKINSVNHWLAILIFGPVLALYIITIVEFWAMREG